MSELNVRMERLWSNIYREKTETFGEKTLFITSNFRRTFTWPGVGSNTNVAVYSLCLNTVEKISPSGKP